MVATAWTLNSPATQAAKTSSDSISSPAFAFGMMTPWVPVSAPALHTAKKPSTFSVTGADRLHMAELVDGAGYREVLTQRHARESAQETAHLGGGGGIAVDAAIALFEGDRRGEGQRMAGLEQVAQQAAEDVEALGMDGARQFGLALDIDHAGAAGSRGRGDTLRKPKVSAPVLTTASPLI